MWRSRKPWFTQMVRRLTSEQMAAYAIRLVGSMLVLVLTFGLLYQIYMEENYAIYDTTLRFHVRAASDSAFDQELKLIVRDAVLDDIKVAADQAESAEALEMEIAGRLKEVAGVAACVLREKGSENEVKVSMTKERFPLRIYGGVVFPAGEYRALRVDIGAAEGHNWWCAIYPELCYNTEGQSGLSDKGETDMEESISESERNVISCGKVRFRFKILEWLAGGESGAP
ncbi:MAG: stage II sporulation protein R [Clostridiales bacterium]|nr:stage II sporulation protein R [Clostridiales bacterium]